MVRVNHNFRFKVILEHFTSFDLTSLFDYGMSTNGNFISKSPFAIVILDLACDVVSIPVPKKGELLISLCLK